MYLCLLVPLLCIGKCTLGTELENWQFIARAPVKAATPYADPSVYITFPTAYSEIVTSPNKQATDINTVDSGRCYSTDRTLLQLLPVITASVKPCSELTVRSWQVNNLCWSRNSPRFMEHEISSQCSQESNILSQINPVHEPILLRQNAF